MALPDGGFISGTPGGEAVKLALPEELKITYEDSGFRGYPSKISSDLTNDATADLDVSYRYLRVELRYPSTASVGLVDRIE